MSKAGRKKDRRDLDRTYVSLPGKAAQSIEDIAEELGIYKSVVVREVVEKGMPFIDDIHAELRARVEAGEVLK